VGLVIHVQTLVHSLGRQHGPEQGVDDDVFFVLFAGFDLRAAAHEPWIVEVSNKQ
jgi:hypothetical protein